VHDQIVSALLEQTAPPLGKVVRFGWRHGGNVSRDASSALAVKRRDVVGAEPAGGVLGEDDVIHRQWPRREGAEGARCPWAEPHVNADASDPPPRRAVSATSLRRLVAAACRWAST